MLKENELMALKYRKVGLNTIPCSSSKKHPLIAWKRWQNEMPSDRMLHVLFHKTKDSGLCILTGCGLVVLDIDCDYMILHDNFLRSLITDTLTCRTKHGFHFYFYSDEPAGNKSSLLNQPIDIRGDGGLVVCPPHKNRHWIGGFDVDRIMRVGSIDEIIGRIKIPTVKSIKSNKSGYRNSDIVVQKCSTSDNLDVIYKASLNNFTLNTYLKAYYQGEKSDRSNTYYCTLCEDPEPMINKALEYHPDTDEFHCYACWRSGNLIDMVMYDRGLDEKAAIEWVLEQSKIG